MARVSTMKLGRRPSGARKSGSSGCSGMKTVPLPPLVTRSRPWSKNWPKNVIHELNGADRPASGDDVFEEEHLRCRRRCRTHRRDRTGDQR